MASNDEIKILVKAEVESAIKNLNEVDKSSDKIEKSYSSLSGKLKGFTDKIKNGFAELVVGVGGAIKSFQFFLNAAVTQEQAINKLRAIAKSTGLSFEDVNTAVKQLSKDGLMSFQESALAVSNLLASGLSLPKTIELLSIAKDNANPTEGR